MRRRRCASREAGHDRSLDRRRHLEHARAGARVSRFDRSRAATPATDRRRSRSRPAWWTTARATAAWKPSGAASHGCAWCRCRATSVSPPARMRACACFAGAPCCCSTATPSSFAACCGAASSIWMRTPTSVSSARSCSIPMARSRTRSTTFRCWRPSSCPRACSNILFRRRFPSRRWAGRRADRRRGGRGGGAVPARVPAARRGPPARGLLLLPGRDGLVPLRARGGLAGRSPAERLRRASVRRQQQAAQPRAHAHRVSPLALPLLPQVSRADSELGGVGAALHEGLLLRGDAGAARDRRHEASRALEHPPRRLHVAPEGLPRKRGPRPVAAFEAEVQRRGAGPSTRGAGADAPA